MTDNPQTALLEDQPADHGDGHNVTDWFLAQVHDRYGRDDITKDDVWHYLYGVMHAPDWRDRYRHDLARQLPRVPLADGFAAFRDAGAELMALHAGYEDCPEHPDVACVVDDQADGPGSVDDPYRITARKMWWKLEDDRKTRDMTVLYVNDRCRLEGIPAAAHDYKVSGRSPLEWAVDQLRHKHDEKTGIVDDPNGWHVWADEPFELIRHLRRLVFVGTETARIVAGLPLALPA